MYRQRGSTPANSTAFTPVVFPVPFTSVPIVLVTARSLSANGAPHITGLTASGFSVALSSQSGGAITGTVDWLAEL